MNINELMNKVHETANNKGFWECSECKGKGYIQYNQCCPTCNGTGKYGNDGEKLMLMVSEISETLEEFRKGYSARDISNFTEILPNNAYYLGGENGIKPEGWAVELADCLIRILDFVKYKGIDDFEKIILDKMEYNSNRPYKHNKKF
jgi:RecJ-like exonuclease